MQTRGFSSDRDRESSSGSIWDAGGAFGRREQAEEKWFFGQKTKEQLDALKKHRENEIYHHKKSIERMEKETTAKAENQTTKT
ncbi:ATPase inhibitor, mitochondrial [Fukomys damarensis]|uniref:ATPase inhibitor, mitochondrial n=1 Tax=Fukomys damarensis TaxID=885580 RepID=A0A091DB63_FUKDA|nr:ATPase inhibitor, mitochondrial [Fukomys damarensis]